MISLKSYLEVAQVHRGVLPMPILYLPVIKVLITTVSVFW